MPPASPIPSSALAPAHIIIQEHRYVDIIYLVWSKDMSFFQEHLNIP